MAETKSLREMAIERTRGHIAELEYRLIHRGSGPPQDTSTNKFTLEQQLETEKSVLQRLIG